MMRGWSAAGPAKPTPTNAAGRSFHPKRRRLRVFACRRAGPGTRGRLILSFLRPGPSPLSSLAAQDGITPRLRYDEFTTAQPAPVSPFRKGLHLTWDNTVILVKTFCNREWSGHASCLTASFRPGPLRQPARRRLSGPPRLRRGDAACTAWIWAAPKRLPAAALCRRRQTLPAGGPLRSSASCAARSRPRTAWRRAQWAASKDKARKAIEKSPLIWCRCTPCAKWWKKLPLHAGQRNVPGIRSLVRL